MHVSTTPTSPPAIPHPDALGAIITPNGVLFRVWAGIHSQVSVVFPTLDQTYPLVSEGDGYFSLLVPHISAGRRYWYEWEDGQRLPDPASRSQPDGVDGPSEVVSLEFAWTDKQWQGRPLDDLIIYELHVGTATPEGTFDALIPKLDYFVKLGVTALQLLPVGQFPGTRNWGYDVAYHFAPANVYGGVQGLQRLVNAAHRHGLAIILDVIYNHVGPEGNHWQTFGRQYFDETEDTPWGKALNYALPSGHATRAFVLANALEWIHDYHIDGLRLDAIHEIRDKSNPNIVQTVTEAIRASVAPDRKIILMAEDARQYLRTITAPAQQGYGFDAVWADEFHHRLHRLLTGETQGYYEPLSDKLANLVPLLQKGWNETSSPADTSATPPPAAYVHYLQNHDQVGNRPFGKRLHHLISAEAYRAASALFLLTPGTPLVWMGQEWATETPFLYFTDYQGGEAEKVEERRVGELKDFSEVHDPEQRAAMPHPQAKETFLDSKLRWEDVSQEAASGMLCLYQTLLKLRQQHPALQQRRWEGIEVIALPPQGVALLYKGDAHCRLLLLVNLGTKMDVDLERLPLAGDFPWQRCYTTEEAQFGGNPSAIQQQGRTYHFTRAGAVILEQRLG